MTAVKEEFKIDEAYRIGATKSYLFEDKNLDPVASCKVVELPNCKAYALPAFKMDPDSFVEGATKSDGKKQNTELTDLYIQEVDSMYELTGEPYLYNKSEAVYMPISINPKSEVLNVIQGDLLDGLALNTVYDSASNILVQNLEGFRVPAKLQKICKYINIFLPHTTNEMLQKEYEKHAEEVAELYGNICAVKVMISPKPQRDQIETSWFEFRGALKSEQIQSKRRRSSTGRYPSPSHYLIYPNKEIKRVEGGKAISTGIHDALFVDQFYQGKLNDGDKIHKTNIGCGYVIGYHRQDGATVFLPVGAGITCLTVQDVIDINAKEIDSLTALANMGLPITLDNLAEVRKLISSSNRTCRGVGNASEIVFNARPDRVVTRDSYSQMSFY